MDDVTIATFAALFQGRMDIIGNGLTPSLPIKPEDYDIERFAWADWLGECKAHLDGDGPIGSYPFLPDGVVTWGCVDFDEGEDESAIHARNLTAALHLYGITAWIERSRSKGYHVWVFPEERIEAKVMRRALLAACQIVDAPTKEINPKQERLPTDRVGNFVRLPYPCGRERGRQVMVEWIEGSAPREILLEDFLTRAPEHLAGWAELDHLAEQYEPPAPPKPLAPESTWNGEGVPPYVQAIIDGGPMDGDRSDWLWRLCRIMRERGLDVEAAWPALQEADWQHGKFMERGPSGARHLREMLEKAYR